MIAVTGDVVVVTEVEWVTSIVVDCLMAMNLNLPN